MVSWGIIKRSTSWYNNPHVVVKEKNGGVRLVLDANKLHEIIVGVSDTPANIDDILQKFHECKFQTPFDLTCGYWNISLAKESRPCTAFLHEGLTRKVYILMQKSLLPLQISHTPRTRRILKLHMACLASTESSHQM
ncbi:uncharacterized protein LOC126426982 [Schistocerca serialis cubense]|uniref:uncharacterized protein LOC126426982 n=1 Tax=Schistocerca serialis cubense TaxID=2023355 RepID=UPI00214ED169|nr:uncharacterized protein LOC126426982 [Schistocerca serialis cubense]